MKKLLLLAFTALCIVSCNSNADNGSSGDSSSTSTMGGDSMSSGSGSGTSNMQGTGADTGYHGLSADSSRMGATDTAGRGSRMRSDSGR